MPSQPNLLPPSDLIVPYGFAHSLDPADPVANLTQPSWPHTPLWNLARPKQIPAVYDPIDAFLDSAAVREFSLFPKLDRWSVLNHTFLGKHPTTMGKEMESRLWVQRNSTLKVKNRSWVTMLEETPTYDLDMYQKERAEQAKLFSNGYLSNQCTDDPLNLQSFPICRQYFQNIGHYASHLRINPPPGLNASEMGENNGTYLYGPYLYAR